MKIEYTKDGTLLQDADNFDIEQIFDCGQCFRFDKDGTFPQTMGKRYGGVAFGKHLFARQSDRNILLENVTKEEFENIWYPFFDMERDYGKIISDITDAHAKKCAEKGRGIRILRQDPWETVCSFIVSQNNNIPRIKKIIATLCDRFGESFTGCDGVEYKAFPSAESLYNAGETAIFECRTGFRAKYIYDAAKRVCTGEFDIQNACSMSASELEAELLKIKGVGPKVAACAGLFGFGHTESFPVDVWIKRVMAKYYPADFDVRSFGENAGIIQQYLFYYERSVPDNDQH